MCRYCHLLKNKYPKKLIFGGLPWQAYFQRVLSADNDRSAQVLSFAAPAGCILLVIPPILIGAAAKVADWTQTELGIETIASITSGLWI